MRQQGPEARFDAARQIDALPQHDGSAQNLGIPLAQFGIADQYDREGRRRKVVQMFENLYTVVACQVAAKPDAVDVDQCESVFFAGFVKEYYNRGIQMYRFPNSDVQKSVIFEGIKKRLKIV